MGKATSMILAAVMMAIALQETVGFVRVGRTEERNRGKNHFDQASNEHSGAVEIGNGIKSELGKLLKRREINQMALVKLLIKAYSKRDKGLYLESSEKERDGLRRLQERSQTILNE